MTIQSLAKYPSKMPSAIFLDSAGVINDNTQRAPQWIRYLSEYIPTTVLGGTAQVWGQANAQIIRPFFSRWHEYMMQAIELAAEAQAKAIAAGQDPAEVESESNKETNVYWIFERYHLLIWIKEMCRVASPHLPELESKILPGLTDDELVQLGRSAHIYAIERVRADYPGAVDAIRKLDTIRKAHGDHSFKLCTSSSDSFEDLQHILKGLGVLECFDDLYGSDKVNSLKISSLYYQRVFSRVGVNVVQRDGASGVVVEGGEDRDEVVVLDDSVKALSWARVLGARTVLISAEAVDLSAEGYSYVDYQLKALSELPGLLESWRAHLAGCPV
ncbi:hypothetical protein BGZ58_008976 [Dissophora ornata]|nr:hypothetical protein BGZ58_008976 [Dissophora ornata]